MGEDEVLRKNARTIIGKGKIDILDKKYRKRELDQVPGPGAY